jgi:hypothetical protein
MPFDNNGGAPLSLANDDIQIVLQNNAQAQDAVASFSIAPSAGGYTPASLIFEKCLSASDFALGVFSALSGVTRLDTFQPLPAGTITTAGSATMQFSAPVSGFYAVRMRLVTALTTGSILAFGSSSPPVAGAPNPTTFAILSGMKLSMDAYTLAMCDQTGQDYFAIASGFSYS